MDQQTETKTQDTDLKPGIKKSPADSRGVKRLKPKFPVPQSLNEAADYILLVGEKRRAVMGNNQKAEEKIAKINEVADRKNATNLEDLKLIYESLKTFAEANRSKLLSDSDTKTVLTPHGTMSWRDDPPSVEITEGKLDEVIKHLEANLDLSKFLRQPPKEVDKTALLADKEAANKIPNVSIVQGEEFGVRPKGNPKTWITSKTPTDLLRCTPKKEKPPKAVAPTSKAS